MRFPLACSIICCSKHILHSESNESFPSFNIVSETHGLISTFNVESFRILFASRKNVCINTLHIPTATVSKSSRIQQRRAERVRELPQQ